MNAVPKTMPDQFEDKVAEAAALLRTMGNENRLMILCRLGGEELSVGVLGQSFQISQSALSQHLAVLRDRELVATRKEGQTVYYRIADPAVGKIITTLASIYCPEMLL